MTSIKDWALFCTALLFLMIGIHQAMIYGFWPSYWAFMISASCLMYYGYRKKNINTPTPSDTDKKKTTSTAKKRRK
jgi:phosphotransferase system  glucose/maltose/N-acetylglucosamine-specific IIC component